eukprot:5005353-Lingulodinium_polyedra.AAC.1
MTSQRCPPPGAGRAPRLQRRGWTRGPRDLPRLRLVRDAQPGGYWAGIRRVRPYLVVNLQKDVVVFT